MVINDRIARLLARMGAFKEGGYVWRPNGLRNDEDDLTRLVPSRARGVHALYQAIMQGRMSVEDARALLEESPRLAACIREGLSGHFGEVTPRRFIELAREGKLTGDWLSRALS